MNEREVECSRCDNTTIIVRDSTPKGWVFVADGWDSIKGTYFCPECSRRYLRSLIVIEQNKKKYPKFWKENE